MEARTLTISTCDSCPHFGVIEFINQPKPSFYSNKQGYCRLAAKSTGHYSEHKPDSVMLLPNAIPEWCPLPRAGVPKSE